MRLVELLTDRAMRKIVHCYCRDCIRPDAVIEQAPQLFFSTELPVPTSMCLEFVYSERAAPAPAQIKFSDVSTLEYTCWCDQCAMAQLFHIDYLSRDRPRPPLWESKKVEFFVIDGSKRSAVQTSETYTFCVQDKNKNKYCEQFILLSNSETKKYTLDEFPLEMAQFPVLHGDYEKKILCSETHNQCKGRLGEEKYILIDEGRLSEFMTYEGKAVMIEHSGYWGIDGNWFNYGLTEKDVFNICYYGKYKGFRSCSFRDWSSYAIYPPEQGGYNCIEPFEPPLFAELIIAFRDEKNCDPESWGEGDDCHDIVTAANYYRVMDQWCYECEKYKGACLGHVYPEPDEFKGVMPVMPVADALARIDVLEERLIALEEALVEMMRGR